MSAPGSQALAIVALLVALAGCSGGGSPPDAGVERPAVADAIPGRQDAPDVAPDAPAPPTPDGPPDAAPDVPSDVAADREPADGAGDTRAPDASAACTPAPDQRGFFASCSACPNPGDCDTIDINGTRRYACGCGGGCPCSLRCGSYTIPGTAIVIGGICVR
jgi:hypothetical protein